MAQTNELDARIFAKGPDDLIQVDFRAVHYISFVSAETYGIPALLTEHRVKDEGLPVKILYVNTANILAMEAVRKH